MYPIALAGKVSERLERQAALESTVSCPSPSTCSNGLDSRSAGAGPWFGQFVAGYKFGQANILHGSRALNVLFVIGG